MKIIPELRFPEFEENGEWNPKSLDETGKIVTGKTPSTKDASLWDGEILFITPTDIEENQKYQLETKRTIVRNEKLDILPEGSIAYTCIASIGKMAITSKESVTNQQINSIIVKENYHNEFIYYSLLHITPFIKSRPATSTLPIINKTEFSGFVINIPKPQEQQKIASCLSSLDELIIAHNQKLEALKNHKKGLMQNLFPQEGQKVPNYRFPEFEKDGEWVRKKLGDAANFINGRAYKKEELLTSGKYRVLRVGNFFTNNEWYYSDLELDEDKYCDNGDLLYAWSASFGPRIWKEEKVIYHYHIWKVIEKIGVDKSFLFVLLDFETENIKAAQARGLGMQHLTKSGIESWESTIPPSEKEQNKIASCLSAVDGLIIAQSEKIEQLQQHKKGLMQGLFPNPSASSGETIEN